MKNILQAVKTTVIVCSVAVLTACGGDGGGEMMGGDFVSLNSCLSAIKKNSGYELNITTDTPEKVSGNLKTGERRFFACERVESGSKGTYYRGYYSLN